jgi:hypothetical protein
MQRIDGFLRTYKDNFTGKNGSIHCWKIILIKEGWRCDKESLDASEVLRRRISGAVRFFEKNLHL